MFMAHQPEVLVTLVTGETMQGRLVSKRKEDRLVLADAALVDADMDAVVVDGQVILSPSGWVMMQVVD